MSQRPEARPPNSGTANAASIVPNVLVAKRYKNFADQANFIDCKISQSRQGPESGRPPHMPGMAWMLAAIYLWNAIMCRAILHHWGVPIPFRLVSQIGNIVAFVLLAVGVFVYTRNHPIHQIFRVGRCRLIYGWFLLLLLFGCYGIIRGNDWSAIGRESMAFCYIGFFLILGGDDRFWAQISKHLTVLFYMSAFLVVVFSTTPMVQVIGDEVFQDYVGALGTGHRNIFSLGFTLRPTIASGMFLGIWGLVGKDKGLWAYLQVSAFLVAFGIEAGLFLFRSSGVYILLAGLGYFLLRPRLERSAQAGKSAMIAATAIIGLMVFAKTTASDDLQARFFEETLHAGLFESRNGEVKAYLEQSGWQALLGRGVGGSFDATGATAWTGSSYDARMFANWATMHYGILIFFLKGGILMLALFASLLTPALRRRSRGWYKNPCNLAAALLFPASVLMITTDPIPFGVESLLFMLALIVPLSRFGKRGDPGVIPMSRKCS
jgi:hypothetical protein